MSSTIVTIYTAYKLPGTFVGKKVARNFCRKKSSYRNVRAQYRLQKQPFLLLHIASFMCTIEKMATRTIGFAQVLLGLTFLFCSILVSEQQCSQHCCLAPLVQSTSFSPSLLPHYFGSTIASHLCEWERRSR